MSTTRREFLKDVTVGAAGLVGVGSLDLWAADTKYRYYVHKFVYKKGQGGPRDAD